MSGKSTIIISELSREDCLKLPKLIRKDIIHKFGNDSIHHWSELFGLSRLVIVLETESIAVLTLDLLKESYPSLNIHISESILPRHRSFDNLEGPAQKEFHLCREPEPIYSLEAHSPVTGTQKVLLEPLVLPTSASSDDGKYSPKSPRITLEYDQ